MGWQEQRERLSTAAIELEAKATKLRMQDKKMLKRGREKMRVDSYVQSAYDRIEE